VHNVIGGIWSKPTFIISESSSTTPNSSPRFLRLCIFVIIHKLPFVYLPRLTNLHNIWLWHKRDTNCHPIGWGKHGSLRARWLPPP
jgi:hypothetical protein